MNDSFSDIFPRVRDLFQNSILAPLLFDIFIDDLATSLDQMVSWDPAPHSLLFADDVKICHPDADRLQQMLCRIDSWSVGNGMMINVKKSAVLTSSNQDFFLVDDILPKISSYVYLGFPHHRRGIAWTEYVQIMIIKAKRQFASICDVATSWPHWIRLSIYRIFIRPQLEYGLAVVVHLPEFEDNVVFAEVETFHNSCLSWIIGIKNRMAVARSLIGLPSLADRMFALAMDLFQHLQDMHQENPASAILQWYRIHIS